MHREGQMRGFMFLEPGIAVIQRSLAFLLRVATRLDKLFMALVHPNLHGHHLNFSHHMCIFVRRKFAVAVRVAEPLNKLLSEVVDRNSKFPLDGNWETTYVPYHLEGVSATACVCILHFARNYLSLLVNRSLSICWLTMRLLLVRLKVNVQMTR